MTKGQSTRGSMRAIWTWRETRVVRAALLRMLREPLTAPAIMERVQAVSEISERRLYRQLRWHLDAGNIVRIGVPRHGSTYVLAGKAP
jgi:hypothetical protein